MPGSDWQLLRDGVYTVTPSQAQKKLCKFSFTTQVIMPIATTHKKNLSGRIRMKTNKEYDKKRLTSIRFLSL